MPRRVRALVALAALAGCSLAGSDGNACTNSCHCHSPGLMAASPTTPPRRVATAPPPTKISSVAAILSSTIGIELGNLLGSGHDHGQHAQHVEHAQFGGSVMQRTFTEYVGLPIGEDALVAAGWYKHGTACDPKLGFAWTQASSGATKDKPMKLYTTSGGQPAGVGIIILGHGEEPMAGDAKQWATVSPLVEPKNDPNISHIDVAFRAGDIMCSGATDAAAIGDTLVVNPSGPSTKSLPLNVAEAKIGGWKKGSCFDGMGWHWFFDETVGGGNLSWQADNLFPVVTMYDKGDINAIFFASTINQVAIPLLKSNAWEPRAIKNSEMCKNMCDPECTFAGLTSAGPWSTAHIYFKDHSLVKCEANLQCMVSKPNAWSCCEKDVVV